MRQRKQEEKDAAFSIITLDDDPIMTSTLQVYFQRSGYRVDVENDPITAIERIRNGTYDILLLDFLMTPICGDQVVEQIRQFNRDIFIILLTGHKSMAPPIKTIRALDIQGYYEKSDRFDQLELLVESCAKAIRQMRTIRNYKDGLSTMMDGLPQIYALDTIESIADTILRTITQTMQGTGAALSLNQMRLGGGQSGADYASYTVGEPFYEKSDAEISSTLLEMVVHGPLIKDDCMIFPLYDLNQEMMGLLAVAVTEKPTYDRIQLMEIFARQAAAALHNAAMHVLLQEKNMELDQAYGRMKDNYMEMISAMRLIVDAKDIYTRGHSDRVSYYSVEVAKRLGKDEAFCECIRITGLFHDIGKLSVPDKILLKDSGLTDEEYEVIKGHPQCGADLLSVISQFRQIIPGVLSHHERIDGLGYPNSLLGEQIPEEARIIAVADSFDAMTSDRHYRKSLSFERAVDELERGKGTQFDLEIADAFIRMVHEPGFWEKMRLNVPDVQSAYFALPNF